MSGAYSAAFSNAYDVGVSGVELDLGPGGTSVGEIETQSMSVGEIVATAISQGEMEILGT